MVMSVPSVAVVSVGAVGGRLEVTTSGSGSEVDESPPGTAVRLVAVESDRVVELVASGRVV